MRRQWRERIAAAFLAFVVPGVAVGAEAPTGLELQQIVQQLGSGSFEEREAAQRALERVPAEQLESFLAIVKGAADSEVKQRLRQRAFEMAGERIARQAQGPGNAVQVIGRVVDGQGRPVADLPVRVSAPAMGEAFAEALPVVRTDAAGEYRVGVPYADVLYGVTVARAISGLPPRPVLPEINRRSQDLPFPTPTKASKGMLVDEAGLPVAGQPLEIFGEDTERRRLTTDAGGGFTFDSSTGDMPRVGPLVARVLPGGPVAVGERNVVIDRGQGNVLRLGKSARISGVVRDATTGRGIGGARVIAGVAAVTNSEFRLVTQTDAGGHYAFSDVPPSVAQRVGYWVVAEAPGYRYQPAHQPPDPDLYFDPVRLNRVPPGETLTADLVLQRPIIVVGRVLNAAGRPVAGALIGTDARGMGDFRDAMHFAASDAQGRFVVAVGRGERTIAAFASAEGLDRETLDAGTEGEIVERDLHLHGTVRVKGQVTDREGRPIRDVACLPGGVMWTVMFTGEDGRFDVGRVPCMTSSSRTGGTLSAATRSSGKVEMLFRAPRPYRDWGTAYSANGVTYDPNRWQTPPTFYQHQLVAVGDAGEMKVVLEPARLIEFTGVVVDAQEKPVEKAAVMLLTGNAHPDKWLALARGTGRDGRPAAPDMSAPVLWGSPWTGADGRFRLMTVVENGVGTLRGTDETDWNTYAIGVWAGNRDLLIRHLPAPESGTREMVIRLDAGK